MLSLGARPSTPVHRAGAVTVPMLLAVLLTGCGSDGSAASDPAPSSPSTASSPSSPSSPAASSGSPGSAGSRSPSPGAPSPTGGATASGPGAVESDEVAILSATAAGGQVGTGPAVPLPDDAAVRSFGAQFTAPELADRISRVVARTEVPAGRTLYGAVVAVGCDVPPGVLVSTSDEGVVITAQPAKASQVQCFAPMTSVALVLVTDQ